MARKHDDNNLLAQAEGEYAHRRNRLGLALLRVGCDKQLASLCEWIFNVTHGGCEGHTLQKSYEQLAAKPWGLCCGLTKARTTVEMAEDAGLITVKRDSYVSGGQTANCYAIDWEGVDRILGLGPGAATRQAAGVATRHRGAAWRQGGAATRHPFKETTSLSISFNSGPGPETGSDPVGFSERSQERSSATSVSERAPRLAPPERDELCLEERSSVTSVSERPSRLTPPERDELRLVLLREHALLREACQRRVAPGKPGGLVGNAFAPLTQEHLNSTGWMVKWFVQQLGCPDPVVGGTESDLLLVLAMAMHVMRMPASDVRKNRVAAFVTKVSRRKWRDACPHVAAARQALDAFRERFPDAIREEA